MSYGVGLRNGVAFALGTIPSLTSGGGLRPSLLLNFLSGSLDSRITFSRGTQATQYTSNGTLQYAPNNLLTYSNQADNAAWTKSNSFVQTNLLLQSEDFTVSPWANAAGFTSTRTNTAGPNGFVLGSITATSAGGGIRQTITSLVSGAVHTLSFYLQSTSTAITLQLENSLSTYGTACFGVLNPVTGASSSVGGFTSITSQALGSGWVYTVVLPAAGGSLGANIELKLPNNGDTMLFGRPQFVRGSVPGDYRATTSAALPVLYADYQGNLRARKVCEASGLAIHRISQSFTPTTAGVFTQSYYAKAGERNWFAIQSDFGSNNTTQLFNLSTGALGSTLGLGGTATITSVGGGWYRCSLTTVTTTTTGGAGHAYVSDSNSSAAYTGDGSSGIYISDAQLEAGSTVQAYNDTTSAAYYGPRFDYDPTNYVRQNLLTYSQDFTNAVWGKSNCTVTGGSIVAPDGTLTGTLLSVNTTAFAYINFTSGVAAATATNNTFVISITAGTVASAELGLYDGTGWGTGTATIISGPGSLTNTTGSRYLVSGLSTSQWTRVAITRTSASATGLTPYIYPRAQGTSQAGDTLYIWGAQLNTGSTALTYTATTTAPYTLCAARGLLIEEQRTNYLIRSSEFDSSTWQDASPNFPTVTANAILSPDGTVNADLLTASTGGVNCASRQVAATGTTGNFTGSFFLKAGTSTRSRILLADTTTAFTVIGDFQIAWTAGVASVFSTTSGTASIVAVNNGWYRCIISASTASANASIALAVFPDVVLGTGTVYAYGAQAEAGAFAASYIPTVGSQVTRAADSASITTLTPWFNAAAGTMLNDYDVIAPISGAAFAVSIFHDGTASNRTYVFIGGGSGAPSLVVTSGGVAQANIGNSVIAANTATKTAGAYALNDFAVVTNGGTVATDLAGSLPVGQNKLELGSFLSGAFLNGHLRNFTYYPTRLPDASIKGLTV